MSIKHHQLVFPFFLFLIIVMNVNFTVSYHQYNYHFKRTVIILLLQNRDQKQSANMYLRQRVNADNPLESCIWLECDVQGHKALSRDIVSGHFKLHLYLACTMNVTQEEGHRAVSSKNTIQTPSSAISCSACVLIFSAPFLYQLLATLRADVQSCCVRKGRASSRASQGLRSTRT